MTQKFINNFSTTVFSTFGATDTQLNVVSAVGLPVLTGGDFFLLTLFRRVGVVESGHEVVKVTAVTGNMLTVVRAFEGAAGSVFNVGSIIEARVTAGSLSTGFVSDAERAKLVLISGTNTGDQTLPTLSSLGLSNVTNTSDANKPVSTAQQTALNLKANLTANTFTGLQTFSAGITETVYALTGTTPAFLESNGSVQTWTLSGASTPTDSLTAGQSILLSITPGAYSVTWPAGMIWTKSGGSGTAPTLYSAGKTIVILWKIGTVLYGSYLGDTL